MDLALSFMIDMCIAVFCFKGGGAYFFVVSKKFYKQVFFAVAKLPRNPFNAHISGEQSILSKLHSLNR